MWSVESDTEKLVRGLLSESSPSVPPRTQRVGASEVSWWEGKPGDAVVMASGGSAADRTLAEQVVVAQLEGCGYKRARFTFDATRDWDQILGPEAEQEWHGEEFDPYEVPPYLYRTMSEDHYQQSLRDGYHQSDERGNYLGQAKESPDDWKDEDPIAEGTVAGRWAYPGYLLNSPNGIGRIVKIRVDPEDEWSYHPEDEGEGGYYHTFKPIPIDRFEAVSQPINSKTWKHAFRHTAGWPDIMEKAKRLIQSGNVTILRNGWNNIIGHVIGDHGEYNTEIGRDDPESRTITTWQCECPWDQYAWQRTRKWKKYEGRPCSHVMALYWKSLATPLDDYDPNQHGPMTPGQNQGPPPGGRPLPTGPGMPKGLKPETPSTPQMPSVPGAPTPAGETPSPVETEGPQQLAPPQPSNVLPQAPMDQLAEMQPPVPGQTPGGMPANPNIVSVPGAKMPTPFNPIQFPGGTYSSAPEEPPNYRKGDDKEHCGNCKMHFEGQCWGYGNKPIEADHVCDSWYLEGKESKVKLAFEEFVPPEIVRLKEDCYGMAEGKSEAHGAGQYRLVPAGSSGEVLAQDPTTGWVEVIFPLDESGPLEPYHVRCYVDASDLVHSRQQPPGPFIKRRR